MYLASTDEQAKNMRRLFRGNDPHRVGGIRASEKYESLKEWLNHNNFSVEENALFNFDEDVFFTLRYNWPEEKYYVELENMMNESVDIFIAMSKEHLKKFGLTYLPTFYSSSCAVMSQITNYIKFKADIAELLVTDHLESNKMMDLSEEIKKKSINMTHWWQKYEKAFNIAIWDDLKTFFNFPQSMMPHSFAFYAIDIEQYRVGVNVYYRGDFPCRKKMLDFLGDFNMFDYISIDKEKKHVVEYTSYCNHTLQLTETHFQNACRSVRTIEHLFLGPDIASQELLHNVIEIKEMMKAKFFHDLDESSIPSDTIPGSSNSGLIGFTERGLRYIDSKIMDSLDKNARVEFYRNCFMLNFCSFEDSRKWCSKIKQQVYMLPGMFHLNYSHFVTIGCIVYLFGLPLFNQQLKLKEVIISKFSLFIMNTIFNILCLGSSFDGLPYIRVDLYSILMDIKFNNDEKVFFSTMQKLVDRIKERKSSDNWVIVQV